MRLVVVGPRACRRCARVPTPAQATGPTSPRRQRGGGAGAGAGSGKDGKKARRRKYTPFRVEDEDELPEGYVNPMSQTYGTDEDIAPAPRRDDGWDLRQW